ncbi:VOC family protein [Nocardia sp. bgisy118]|uniref:VOC family protein n=1 Tax=Nocardia sp. bgisy118 TaxID=3413786 RepID=UPI003F49DF7E
MTDTFPAFDIGPVPIPALDAAPPELFRGIYGMPMFVTAPTPDLAASVDFWTRGLGFFDLFSVPGRVTHLRRWAFQDVLLVPNEDTPVNSALSVSFSCVLSQLDEIASACAELLPGCTTGPRSMPWNSVELEIRTPEHTRVIMTAARPYDPNSPEADMLRSIGIEAPEA